MVTIQRKSDRMRYDVKLLKYENKSALDGEHIQACYDIESVQWLTA